MVKRILSLFLALFLLVTSATALADEPEQLPIADTAARLVQGCGTTEEKAMAVYRYISRTFRYDYGLRDAILAGAVTRYIPDPTRTLYARKGICYDLAVLYAAMLHSQEIPVKVIKGYYQGTVYHAWNSVYDDTTGNWIHLDITMDLRRGRHRQAWQKIKPAHYEIKSEALYEG